MKKTPKGLFVINIHNPVHNEAVQKRLFELGYGWSGVQQVSYPQARKVFLSDGKYLSYTAEPRYNSDGQFTLITMDDLYGEKFMGVQSVEVTLNREHKAVVTKGGITVGCQSFPLSIVEALVDAKRKVLE